MDRVEGIVGRQVRDKQQAAEAAAAAAAAAVAFVLSFPRVQRADRRQVVGMPWAGGRQQAAEGKS